MRRGKERESDDEIRLLRAKADKAELEVLEKRAELIDYQVVLKHYIELAQTVKEKLDTIPQACARRCAGVKTPSEVEKIISEEIKGALRALAKDPDFKRKESLYDPRMAREKKEEELRASKISQEKKLSGKEDGKKQHSPIDRKSLSYDPYNAEDDSVGDYDPYNADDDED